MKKIQEQKIFHRSGPLIHLSRRPRLFVEFMVLVLQFVSKDKLQKNNICKSVLFNKLWSMLSQKN